MMTGAFPALVHRFGRQEDPELPIWHIKTQVFWPFGKKQRDLNESVEQALSSVMGTNRLFLGTGENPVDWEIPGSWSEVASDTWLVPDELAFEDLSPLLAPGSWYLYDADAPLPELIPDPWTSSGAVDLHSILVAHDVDVFIASFADDTEWVVILPGRSG